MISNAKYPENMLISMQP